MHILRLTGMRLATAGALASVLAGVLALACNGTTDPNEGDLALLRTATERFADTTLATTAGYTAALTGCMVDAQLGGMGFHIGNAAKTDGTVELQAPEALLYEPQPGGARTLVAVEYLVPFTAWTAAAPPSIMGQRFKRNEAFGVWALHVWVYRDNPSGIFADWNPRVSCAAAPAGTGEPAPMQH